MQAPLRGIMEGCSEYPGFVSPLINGYGHRSLPLREVSISTLEINKLWPSTTAWRICYGMQCDLRSAHNLQTHGTLAPSPGLIIEAVVPEIYITRATGVDCYRVHCNRIILKVGCLSPTVCRKKIHKIGRRSRIPCETDKLIPRLDLGPRKGNDHIFAAGHRNRCGT